MFASIRKEPDPMPPRDFRREFDQSDRALNEGRGYSESTNEAGLLAWAESYLLMAYAEMYQATGDPDYLQRLAEQFDRILKNRDDRRGAIDTCAGKPLAGWGSTSYSDKRWHVWIAHTGMITAGPAAFVRTIFHDRSLQKRFGERAREFRDRIAECIRDAEPYWHNGPAVDEGYYTDDILAAPLPTNQQNALGMTLLEMARATGNRTYRDRAKRLAHYFQRRLRRTSDGLYDWAYWPRPDHDGNGSEDISHAGINIAFVACCERAGVVFTRSDLTRFAATWLRRVKRPGGKWAGAVDGSGDGAQYMPLSLGMWLALCPGLPDTEARALYEDALQVFSDTGVHYIGLLPGIARLHACASRFPSDPRRDPGKERTT